MPNVHVNTQQIRIPTRTAQRLDLLAKKKHLTKSATIDKVMTEHLERHGHADILEATADLPEPRGALPPGVGVGTAIEA